MSLGDGAKAGAALGEMLQHLLIGIFKALLVIVPPITKAIYRVFSLLTAQGWQAGQWAAGWIDAHLVVRR